jgi:hypothetical protein
LDGAAQNGIWGQTGFLNARIEFSPKCRRESECSGGFAPDFLLSPDLSTFELMALS